MKRCYNCKNVRWTHGFTYCDLLTKGISINTSAEIKHPFLMGGPKKCESYEQQPPVKKDKFVYPKKEVK